MNILTKFAAASAVALSLGQGIGFSGAAHATPVTCTAASQGSLELYLADKGCKFPDESEKKVYLDSADGVNVGSGNVGKQTGLPEVSFTSSSKIKLANGFANIKGTDDKSFKDLTFSIPDYTFTDLLFDVQIDNFTDKKKQAFPFSVEGFNGSTSLGKFSYATNKLKDRADLSFMILATGQPMTSVVFTSYLEGFGNGLFELKHFQVSGLKKVGGDDGNPQPVPLPAALPLLLTGLAGLGLMVRRRKPT